MPSEPAPDPSRRPSRRTLPQILPATMAEEPAATESSSTSDSRLMNRGPAPANPATSVHPRTSVTRVACDACRRRRTKCSGDRPSCAACVNYRSACCYSSASPSETNAQALKRRYEEVQAERDIYKELHDYFCRASDAHALGTIHHIRAGTSLQAILSRIQQNDDPSRQSSLAPEPQLRYEFPYSPAMPSAIERSSNMYLDSVLYQIVQEVNGIPEQVDTAKSPPQISQLQQLATRHSPAYLRPYHSARHIDPRLSIVDVTRWTSVIVDNDLFASLISAYITYEYPAFPVFQKDIFLEAMHCHAGIPDRRKYWDPFSLSYSFLAEARRLWELERDQDTLVVAEAAMLLHIAYCHNGIDQLGHDYLLCGLSIGQAIGLFDQGPLSEDQTMSDAMVFAAWSFYRWTTIYSFNFEKPPLMKTAPEVALPSPDERPTSYGDFYLLYPLSDTPFSTYQGYLSKSWTDLRVIINGISQKIYHSSGMVSLAADECLKFRCQLQAWFESLPGPLTAKYIVWPAQLMMHMEYYIVVATINSMLLAGDGTASEDEDDYMPASHNDTCESLTDATANLETLVRLYYLRHSFEFSNSYMVHMLCTMIKFVMESQAAGRSDSCRCGRRGPMSFHGTDAKEHAQSILVLCFKGLAEQAQHFYFAGAMCELLLRHQSPEDAKVLESYMPGDISEDMEAIGERVRSVYPLYEAIAPQGNPRGSPGKRRSRNHDA